MVKADICVIGGGAAGMAAAIEAARAGAKVVIAEKNSRVGKKILSTGNGRCNLTHVSPSEDDYHGDRDLIKNVLDSFGPAGAFLWFKSLGVLLHSDAEGRVYPYSNTASTVLDALRRELDSLGVDVLCDCGVKSINKTDGGFEISASDTIYTKKVIVTTGGKSSPSSGSDGSGFALLKKFGIECTPLKPALTGIKCDGTRALKGIRAKAAVTLKKPDCRQYTERGEVQFTEQGLSGICVFDLSRFADEGDILTVDFLPDYSLEEAENLVSELGGPGDAKSSDRLLGILNRRLAQEVCRNNEKSAAYAAKNMTFVSKGVMPFTSSQVTAGGVKGNETGADLQCVKVPGMYLAGEILDADGRCGGYNLHFAWGSGIIAGTEAAASLKG